MDGFFRANFGVFCNRVVTPGKRAGARNKKLRVNWPERDAYMIVKILLHELPQRLFSLGCERRENAEQDDVVVCRRDDVVLVMRVEQPDIFIEDRSNVSEVVAACGRRSDEQDKDGDCENRSSGNHSSPPFLWDRGGTALRICGVRSAVL